MKIKTYEYWCRQCDKKYIVSETEKFDKAYCPKCKTELKKNE